MSVFFSSRWTYSLCKLETTSLVLECCCLLVVISFSLHTKNYVAICFSYLSENVSKCVTGKPRLSPCRPLPEYVEVLAAASSTDDDGIELIEMLQTTNLIDALQEFDDDVPHEQKEKHHTNATKQRFRKKSAKQEPEHTAKTQEELTSKCLRCLPF